MADFNRIDSRQKLEEVFSRSYDSPVVLFKHSNRCGISSHVLEMVEEFRGQVNVVVIQDDRDLSDEVSARTDYTHQSPQAFVLFGGKAVYHATHYGIDPSQIEKIVRLYQKASPAEA